MTTTEITTLGGTVLLMGAFGYVTVKLLLKYDDWSTRRAADKKIKEEQQIIDAMRQALIPSKKYPFGRSEDALIKICEKELGRQVSISRTIDLLHDVIGAKAVWSHKLNDRVWTFLK